jgi:hypothetical protein
VAHHEVSVEVEALLRVVGGDRARDDTRPRRVEARAARDADSWSISAINLVAALGDWYDLTQERSS